MNLAMKLAVKTLCLSVDATIMDVRQARVRMARVHHPDVAGASRRSAELMAEINAAADLLLDYISKLKPTDPQSSNSIDEVALYSKETGILQPFGGNQPSHEQKKDLQMTSGSVVRHRQTDLRSIVYPIKTTSLFTSIAESSYGLIIGELGKLATGTLVDTRC